MALTVCVYEDSGFRNFSSLTHLRPVYLMRAGIVPLYRRLERHFVDSQVCLATRDCLAPLVAQQCRENPVNIVKRGEKDDVLFLNGRIRDFGDLPEMVKTARLSTLFKNGDDVLGVLFKAETIGKAPSVAEATHYLQVFAEHSSEIADFDSTATLYRYAWEIMADIEPEIEADFKILSKLEKPMDAADVPDGVHVVNPENVVLGDSVKLSPGSVIDASGGPVFIGGLTRVESHATIYGPCYIGPNCQVLEGKVGGSSIGPTCRVGGEVEETIFQSYVNKYHAGFIGHSYVGSWVNFGAMTTNSDLKNNYSNIRVSVNGDMIDTGSIKVGSFIGDHTKFGIGTLLNTGINIGVCCNIFGGGLVTDKEVGSFQWGGTGSYVDYRFDKAIETARRTAGRRNVDLATEEEAVLQDISRGEVRTEGVIDFALPAGS